MKRGWKDKTPMPFVVRVDYSAKYAELVACEQRLDFLSPAQRGAFIARFAHRAAAETYATKLSDWCLSYTVWEEGAP
jgi:hypothetical protein